jgi:hypothetical protein
MQEQEVAAVGRPVRCSEIALGKAIAEVERRVDVKGKPWYVSKQVRCEGGVWFVSAHGTFRIFNDWDTANQKGVYARVALSAKDGKVLRCDIRRGDEDIDAVIQKSAPGVILVTDEKKKD